MFSSLMQVKETEVPFSDQEHIKNQYELFWNKYFSSVLEKILTISIHIVNTNHMSISVHWPWMRESDDENSSF